MKLSGKQRWLGVIAAAAMLSAGSVSLRAQERTLQPADDAVFANNWPRRQTQSYSFLLPNDQWRVAELHNGIQIVSPSGNEQIKFGFSVGSQMVTQKIAGELIQSTGLSNVRFISNDAIGPNGEFAEFVALSAARIPMHGILMTQASSMWFTSYVVFAPEKFWLRDSQALALVRESIVFAGFPK